MSGAKAAAVVGGLVLMGVIGYWVGQTGRGNDDQPIIMTGGSFFIDTNKGHVFNQSGTVLVHSEPNRVLQSVDIYSADPDDTRNFTSGIASIVVGYCLQANECVAPSADDPITFQTDAQRKNLQVLTNANASYAWNRVFSVEFERLPRALHPKWITVTGTDGHGSFTVTHTCPADGTCRMRVHHVI